MRTYGWVLALGTIVSMAGAGLVRDCQASEYSFAWLDPEKKIYVLQNRKFTKAGRPSVSIGGGLGLSNPFRNTILVNGQVEYFFNEEFGLDLFYTYSFQSNSAIFNQLRTQVPTSLPTAREFRGQYGALVKWIPWYAKINVFNSIITFDWHFAGGLGSIASDVDINTNANSAANFVPQTLLGIYVGTGHAYHLTDHFDVKLDLLGSFYQAQEFGNSGNSFWFSNFMLTLGLGYRL